MEKAHDISLDEPCVAHQAILFMLDVLMRSNKSNLTLAELYDSFGDKSFTPQMLRAVGGNEQGLKQFLQRYPSLFSVIGDTISANSGGNQLPRNSTTPERYLRKTKVNASSGDTSLQNTITPNTTGDLINSTASSSSSTISSNGQQTITASGDATQFDIKSMKEIEQEAIAFFRKQISKREEDWLPIVSVAGHASQSSSDVRKFVGPQNEFKAFLIKYPNIFIVRDEYCGLKGKADISTQPFPPPSPPPKRRTTNVTLMGSNGITAGIATLGPGSLLTRGHSFKASNRYSACGNMMPNQTLNLVSANSLIQQMPQAAQQQVSVGINSSPGISKPRLTPVEVKAVHYVMRILHKNGRMLLQTIPGLISRAPDQVSNIVGFTREDLIQFFKRHSAIFQLHPDGCVSVKQDAVKALILKDNINGSIANNASSEYNSSAIISSSGVILRIFPKYGILNMENNEQVFFDIQSCQFETFSDLTTILHTGDRLYFNAIIGPRDGSTKWRSLKTWIKMRSQPSSSNGIICSFDNMSSHSDAEKSDDSSSSSQGGYSKRNNQKSGNSNGLIANSSQIYQAAQGFLGSPSNIGNHSNFSVSSSVGSSSTQNFIMNSNNMNSSPTNFNNDNESSINEIAGTNNLSGNTNMVTSVSGDFNLYQLDSGEYNQTSSPSDANSTLGGPIEESSEFLIASRSKNIIHSSSSNNLPIKEAARNNNDISNIIHTLGTVLLPNDNESNINPSCHDMQSSSVISKSSTKFIRQSADNISERSLSETNSILVSIGCQTLSTGDITVSNVYID